LALAVANRRARGAPIVDLTASNPTSVGLPGSPSLLAALGDSAARIYEPSPFGLAAAREAVAADYRRRGAAVDPAHVVLTSSTSEAYSWLFKMLCDPGSAALVPQPSYPLFDHLTRLEGVRPSPYSLRFDGGRWEIDTDSVDAAPSDVRALVAVSPNNPTGSYVSASEYARITALCARRGWPLILDEVFADYSLDDRAWPTDQGVASLGALTFTLGGFSKTLGLPQLKLGWIVVGGPEADREAALGALELIADSYLSVNAPVQYAAGTLLERAAAIRDELRVRIRETLGAVREAVTLFPACDLLPVEGGWSAVIRVPATRSEERLVLDALEHDGVLVHPGYFFDFPHEAFVVVSLLPEPDVVREGVTQVLARAVA